MNWNSGIRQVHRWTSIVFVIVVMLIFILLGMGRQPPNWIYFLPLLPLALLALTGLYLFALPYTRRARSGG